MFQEHEVISYTLNKVSLRSFTTDISDDQSYKETNAEEFLLAGTICAIAADVKSIDTFWLIKIIHDKETCLKASDLFRKRHRHGNIMSTGL